MNTTLKFTTKKNVLTVDVQQTSNDKCMSIVKEVNTAILPIWKKCKGVMTDNDFDKLKKSLANVTGILEVAYTFKDKSATGYAGFTLDNSAAAAVIVEKIDPATIIVKAVEDTIKKVEPKKVIDRGPRGAAVGQRPTSGYTGLFDGTSWGKK